MKKLKNTTSAQLWIHYYMQMRANARQNDIDVNPPRWLLPHFGLETFNSLNKPKKNHSLVFSFSFLTSHLIITNLFQQIHIATAKFHCQVKSKLCQRYSNLIRFDTWWYQIQFDIIMTWSRYIPANPHCYWQIFHCQVKVVSMTFKFDPTLTLILIRLACHIWYQTWFDIYDLI